MIYFLVLPYALFRWASGREVLAGLAIILVAATAGFFLSWTGIGDLVGGTAVLMTSMALGRGRALPARSPAAPARAGEGRGAGRAGARAARHRGPPRLRDRDPGPGRAGAGREPSRVGGRGAGGDRGRGVARRWPRCARWCGCCATRSPPTTPRSPASRTWSGWQGLPPTGPRVEVKLAGDLATLAAAVDAAVFRIAQESVTNALRHARNATLVEVRVDGDRRRSA